MATDKLTASKLKTLDKPGKYADGAGLHLQITKQGGKYWRWKYYFQGREKLISFGVYPHVSLAKARARRNQAREQLEDGLDPSAERKRQKQALGITFESVAKEWLEKQTNLKANTLALARRRFEKWVYPDLGKTPVHTLEPPDVLEVLRRVESAERFETAHRVRQKIGQVCRYAIQTGRAQRDPTADLKGALSPVPTRNRSAITDPGRVGILLRHIDAYEGQPATVAALHLLALTFVRPGELRWATWAEIDLNKAVWRIPADRMKMKREHIVPLSTQAIKVLTELKPITGRRSFVFESIRPGRPISENTVNVALRTLGYSGDQMTAHGFRAMASTLLHENGFPPEVIELQLAHAQRSQVAAAYNRSARLEERKTMVQWWADHLDELRKRKRRLKKRSSTR